MKINLNILFKTSVPQWQKRILDFTKPYTMVSRENILAIIKSIQTIYEKGIKGDIVECGVWKGGSMMAAALTLKEMKAYDKKIYLYDTFSEFPSPGIHDFNHEGISGSKILDILSENGERWKAPSKDTVMNNLSKTGYPLENIILIEGVVEETIPSQMPTTISLLRLDTDWYSSTMHELIWLYPLLEKQGILIIDDYGYWKGSKKAVDDFFETNKIKLKLHKIDFSSRLTRKI